MTVADDSTLGESTLKTDTPNSRLAAVDPMITNLVADAQERFMKDTVFHFKVEQAVIWSNQHLHASAGRWMTESELHAARIAAAVCLLSWMRPEDLEA